MSLLTSRMSLSRPALWNERCFLISQQRRLYALSRFPTKRAAGPGRSRENMNPKNSSSSQQPIQGKIPLENIPSDSESRLWHTSQRPPASNPEEGLRRLLMENETLIVERSFKLFLGLSPTMLTFDGLAGRWRCSISLSVLNNAINIL